MSYACTQRPKKSRVFAPVFDDLACSYKNEGSIPFTRSTLFLSKFAVFPGTVIRVSYEAARISPVFQGFHSRNRNRGSGAGDPADGLVLSLISPPEKQGGPASDSQHPTGVPVRLKNYPLQGKGFRPPMVHGDPSSPGIGFRDAPGNWGPSQSLVRFWVEVWFAGRGARLDWGRGCQRFLSLQHGGHSGCL